MKYEFDAILIPGGGVGKGGMLPFWVARRLDRAVQLNQVQLNRARYFITLSAGTPHVAPPLDRNRFPIFESVAAAKYLIDAGVSPKRILTETHSYDTIGNAYFSRLIHVDPLRLRRLLVITSEFHLPRTEAAFRWVYGLRPKARDYELQFESVSDRGMEKGTLRARREKERESLAQLIELTNKYTTVRGFHNWLFTEHGAYNAVRTGFGVNSLSAKARKTY